MWPWFATSTSKLGIYFSRKRSLDWITVNVWCMIILYPVVSWISNPYMWKGSTLHNYAKSKWKFARGNSNHWTQISTFSWTLLNRTRIKWKSTHFKYFLDFWVKWRSLKLPMELCLLFLKRFPVLCLYEISSLTLFTGTCGICDLLIILWITGISIVRF